MNPDTDLPSPPSARPAAPQGGTQTSPKPEGEKKPEKKLETPILVAIISAVVTLLTAVLGNPLFLSFVNKMEPPTPTPVVELASSQSTLLNHNPSEGEFIAAVSTPYENGIDIIASSSTPQVANPASEPSFLEATVTPAAIPPEEPPPPTPATPSILDCLAAAEWFPYPTTADPEIDHGCLNLSEWGFSAGQGQLLMVHSPDQDQQRGIYTPISGDVKIRLSVQLDEFRTRKNKAGFLNFGVVQNDPISIYTGGFLSYQQPSPGTDSPVRVLISGSHQATQKISVLEAGFHHEVELSVQDDLMVVYLNGEQVGDPVSLPHTDRAFWIGYVLPAKTELDVKITNLALQSR